MQISDLTENQLVGLQYARQLANEENPEAQHTDESYFESMIRNACDSYYSAVIAEKEKKGLEIVRSLPPAQLEALLEQLQIPDVVTE